MRNLSPQMLDEIQRQHGAESTIVLEVEWVDGGQRVMYSDKKINGEDYPYPLINSIGRFDTSLQVTGSGSAQEIAVVLNDVDGDLKAIFDAYDIHKRPVWVYQAFVGLNLDYKFMLFNGQISSPVVWDEGDRTLSFSVLTREEDAEVAFTMEEGDFPEIPEEALGKVWPLVFGEVCNMQAVQIRAPRRGYLTHGEGIADFTIPHRLCQARYIQCPSVSTGESTTLQQGANGDYTEVDSPTYGPDLECAERRFSTICEMEDLYEQQQGYESATLNIRGGGDFPQGVNLRLNVNGAIYWGSFSGETFTILDRRHPEYDEEEIVPCAPVNERAVGLTASDGLGYWEKSDNGTYWQVPSDSFQHEDCDALQAATRAYTGGPTASQKAFDDMPTSSFFWIPAGTEVFLEAEAEVLYVVSLIPGTLNNVAAYKTQPSGRKLLMEVPSSYYTVYESDYGAYTVTELGLVSKLSLIDDKWGDDLYVSITSDVGGNPVDVIEWLLDTYTGLSYDSTTFNDVKTKLADYPTNFWVKQQVSVLSLIQDIAYQSRCAVYTRNDVMYIKYLAEEPSSVRTITPSDIISSTFRVDLTETEDLVTKYDISWQAGEAGIDSEDEVINKFAVRFNIPKYGLQEDSVDYFTQNTYSTILKSSTFWLIRDSISWKHVKFASTLKMLDLDVFDCVTLDIPQFSASAIKCILTKVAYNSTNHTVELEGWTPVRAGESETYYWAWPAAQSALATWPLPGEEYLAESGNSTVSPPVDHILTGGDTTDDTSMVVTAGDRHPSDLDDTAPVVYCEISDTNEIEEPEPEFLAWELAKSVNRQQMNSNMSKEDPAPGSDASDKEQRTACGSPQYGQISCLYEVVVYYITPTSVTSGNILGGCEGGPCGGGCGKPCTGPQSDFCHTFGARFAAEAFRSSKLAEIANLKANCGYCAGQSNPLWVRGIKTIDAPAPHDGHCVGSPGNEDEPNQGEIYDPLAR